MHSEFPREGPEAREVACLLDPLGELQAEPGFCPTKMSSPFPGASGPCLHWGKRPGALMAQPSASQHPCSP